MSADQMQMSEIMLDTQHGRIDRRIFTATAHLSAVLNTTSVRIATAHSPTCCPSLHNEKEKWSVRPKDGSEPTERGLLEHAGWQLLA